jgi:hypothetical protein
LDALEFVRVPAMTYPRMWVYAGQMVSVSFAPIHWNNGKAQSILGKHCSLSEGFNTTVNNQKK